MQSSRRRSEPGSGSTLLTRMTGKKSPSGPLSRIRSSIATEGPLETAWRNPGKIVWPWRSAPGGYCAPCQKEQSPAEIAELPGRYRTATGRKFSALRSMPGRRRTSRTLMTARQSRAGTLTRTRCSAATERAPRGVRNGWRNPERSSGLVIDLGFLCGANVRPATPHARHRARPSCPLDNSGPASGVAADGLDLGERRPGSGHAPSRLADRRPGRGTAPELAVLCGSLMAHSPSAASAYSPGRRAQEARQRCAAICAELRPGRWTTSEHADWCMNMRSGDALNSAESDAPAWSLCWPAPGGGAGLREVDARYIGGTSQVD